MLDSFTSMTRVGLWEYRNAVEKVVVRKGEGSQKFGLNLATISRDLISFV
jgi:hypothetical protein